jgi:EmrB/QacA subfamily drug resistance transporter
MTTSAKTSSSEAVAKGAGLVLMVLCAAQFIMILDSAVMNVSIATVAADLGTTVTGIQTAITLYMLVMASLMITGGKIGGIIGRRRAFGLGLVIYSIGSFTTAISPNLTVLIIGWSFLEGMGAALILPAIVALVAGNFPTERRTAAYGMVASAGAIAVAAGPLIGGAVTTLFSWRWVFVGEVVVCMAILVVLRKVHDTPTSKQPPIDVVGAIMSIIGLSLVVLGVLKSAEWGWVQPKPEAPALFGVSLTTWFILGGFFVLWLFTQWEARMERLGKEPLLRMELLHVPQLSGGLFMFFFQFLVQASTFFIVPLYLTVVLGLTAFATGVRLVPLSLALLTVAIAVPKFRPQANPRRVVRLGLLALAAGALVMVAGIDPGADASVVTIPMILLGCGMGALASQLGAVTVSAVPDERSAEVGGVQNTATNLGASLGTALIGSILIGSLTVAFISNIQNNPAVPPEVSAQASTQLASGIPFVSESDLTVALNSAGVPDEQATAIVQEYNDASLDALRTSMAFVALFAIVALFFSERIPNKAIGVSEAASASPS